MRMAAGGGAGRLQGGKKAKGGKIKPQGRGQKQGPRGEEEFGVYYDSGRRLVVILNKLAYLLLYID